MIQSSCMCGVVFSGEDMDAAVADGVEHWGSAHPEFGLTEVNVRNYLEAEQRIDGPTERLDEIGEVTIVPVGADVKDDVIEFFDRRVFAGNPAWGMCYCMFHYIHGAQPEVWMKRTWQENREGLDQRISSGATTGVVAFVDGVLAGWCNAGLRSTFPGMSDGKDEGVGSIVCFAIAPPYRRHGVARSLLSGALDLFRDMELGVAEAYPVAEPKDQDVAFVGTLALYESEGFNVVSEEPLIVRKSLN